VDLQLKDLVCLVTGASTGIGRGIAELLAAEGMLLAINSRSHDTLVDVAETIASTGVPRPMIVDDDVTDPAAATRVWEAVTAAYERIDVFVSCTGNAAFVDPLAPEEAWEEAYAVNFSAVRRITQTILPEMRKRKWGRIINITGSMAPFSTSASTAAKAAAQAWAKGLSREVASDGITVNSVVPGRIRSVIADGLYPTEEDRQRFADIHIPAGYFGEPRDFAPMVAFLASPLARYITGTVIDVDGGMRRFAH